MWGDVGSVASDVRSVASVVGCVAAVSAAGCGLKVRFPSAATGVASGCSNSIMTVV
jgi:hypothetical protein